MTNVRKRPPGIFKLIVRSPVKKEPRKLEKKDNTGRAAQPTPEVAALLAAMAAERR